MKKFFVCMSVVALMVAGSNLSAQEAEVIPEAQASASDGIAVEQAEEALPVADGQPITSEVIDDGAVVAGGIVTDGQPIQAFDSCCDCCCEESSFVQPVVFNQPIVSSQPILPQNFISEAIPATFNAEPIAAPIVEPIAAAGCSSCSGAVAEIAPAPVATLAPVATIAAPPVVEAPVVTQNFTPAPAPVQTFTPVPAVTQTFALAPAPTQTFAPAPAPTQTFTSAPVTACAVQATAPAQCCQPTRSTRLFRQRGLLSRLRGTAISTAIDDDNLEF